MFERPLLLWLLIAAPLVAAPGLIAMRRDQWFGAAASNALRLVCFVALVMMLLSLRRLPSDSSGPRHRRHPAAEDPPQGA